MWVFIVVPVLAAVVVWAIFTMSSKSENARRAQTLFAQLDSDTNRLNGFEWEARASEAPDRELFGEYAAVRRNAAAFSAELLAARVTEATAPPSLQLAV